MANDLKLINLGLNFTPTPNWNEKVKNKEWYNLSRHIRQIEWDDYFNKNNELDDIQEKKEILTTSKKLIVPKSSKPQNYKLSEEASTYIEMATNKLRNLNIDVNKNYIRKNNLSKNMRNSLKKLKKLVKKEKNSNMYLR